MGGRYERTNLWEGCARRPNMQRRTHLLLAATLIFAQALAARLIGVACLNPREVVYTDVHYKEYARSVWEGRGYVIDKHFDGLGTVALHAWRPPLFPWLWGLVYGWTNENYTPIRVAHAVLGALTCLLMFFAGRAVFSPRVGVLAGVLAGWYPPLVWHSINLMTEPLFIFWQAAAMCMLAVARRKDCHWAAGIAGACAGLAILSRSMLAGFMPLAAFWLLFVGKTRRRGLALAAALAAGCTLTLSPWIVRNFRTIGAFAPTTLDAGHGFLIGNNAGALRDPRGVSEPESWAFAKGLDEVEMNRAFFRRGLRNLREDPSLWPRLMVDKFCRLWRFWPHLEYVRDDEQDVRLVKPRFYAIIYGIGYCALFPFIIAGAVLAWRRVRDARPDLVLLALLVGYTTGIHMLFIAVLRYRVPLMPFLIVLAAYAIMSMFGPRLGTRCDPRPPLPGGTTGGAARDGRAARANAASSWVPPLRGGRTSASRPRRH